MTFGVSAVQWDFLYWSYRLQPFDYQDKVGFGDYLEDMFGPMLRKKKKPY